MKITNMDMKDCWLDHYDLDMRWEKLNVAFEKEGKKYTTICDVASKGSEVERVVFRLPDWAVEHMALNINKGL